MEEPTRNGGEDPKGLVDMFTDEKQREQHGTIHNLHVRQLRRHGTVGVEIARVKKQGSTIDL